MENKQSYSHGLLLSVAPHDISSLHLNDEDGRDAFDWGAYEADKDGYPIMKGVMNVLMVTAVKWKLIKTD